MECQQVQIIEDSQKRKIQEKYKTDYKNIVSNYKKITCFNLFSVVKGDDLKEFLKAAETTLSEASLYNAIKL
jgi:hypothetical protein